MRYTSGSTTADTDYDPYGVSFPRQGALAQQGFSGHRWDAATGLLFSNPYAPGGGRTLSPYPGGTYTQTDLASPGASKTRRPPKEDPIEISRKEAVERVRKILNQIEANVASRREELTLEQKAMLSLYGITYSSG